MVEHWIQEKEIPNIIFGGPPGIGKTTLAKILFNELNAQPGDVLEINASAERGIDTIRDKIMGFAQTMPLGEYKYILLDESDQMTTIAQMPLRNLMERYHEFTRFILTCNYPEKIEPALKSRCEYFHITQLNKEEFVTRAVNILIKENINFEPEILASYVDATYPDLRSCIKNLQSNSRNNNLNDPSAAVGTEQDYIIQAIDLFKKRKYREARKLITESARPSDYNKIFRILYENLEWWSDNEEIQQQLILQIAEGVRWNNFVGDQEINLSATIISMEQLIK